MILERDDKSWSKGAVCAVPRWLGRVNWLEVVYYKDRVFVLEGDELKGSLFTASGYKGKQYKLVQDLDAVQRTQGYRRYTESYIPLSTGGRRCTSLHYRKSRHIRIPKAKLISFRITYT